MNKSLDAQTALQKLMEGNTRYLTAKSCGGDISPEIRKKTHDEGQSPYAIIITCSDSRVIPESIFDAGIGELFVIRVAGNVIDNHQLGSVEYAAEHLGCRLVLVMGHDRCGAVDAAINHEPANNIKYITDEIKKAIGNVTDECEACRLNVLHSIEVIENSIEIKAEERHGLEVRGALYHTEDGRVELISTGK